MNRADFNYLNQLEAQLRAMHQPHQSCPSHELGYDDDDFERVFGVGDEQQARPACIDQEQFDYGHSSGDFC
jgi:hypothetical protein